MDGEVWDEERWEAFLREHDRRIDRYMSLLFRFMTETPPPAEEGSRARKEWEEDLRQYLIGNGMSPDDILPRLLSGQWSEDDDAESAQPYLEQEDQGADMDDVRHIPVYRDAQRLASQILRWSNDLPGHLKDSALVQFCSHITQIPANIAKGHGIGFELEMIGGNIACSKRALLAANSALDLLLEIKGALYMEQTFYRRIYEDTYEVRNRIGVHIQDLRGRFELGVD
ncbi:MAG: hypothetical protein WD275_01180 [Rhodothermales bacterium]